MQLESEDPAHGGFAFWGNAPENLVNAYPLVPTDTKWRTVYKTDTCAFAKQNLLDKQSQWDSDLPFQFYKTVVRDNLGKQMS